MAGVSEYEEMTVDEGGMPSSIYAVNDTTSTNMLGERDQVANERPS